MKEITVSIRELKTHLSYYLRLAKDGQTVQVTDRGRPIGRIVPVGGALDERLEAMARLGCLLRSEGKLEPKEPVAQTRGRRTLAELLVEDRQ